MGAWLILPITAVLAAIAGYSAGSGKTLKQLQPKFKKTKPKLVP